MFYQCPHTYRECRERRKKHKGTETCGEWLMYRVLHNIWGGGGVKLELYRNPEVSLLKVHLHLAFLFRNLKLRHLELESFKIWKEIWIRKNLEALLDRTLVWHAGGSNPQHLQVKALKWQVL